MERFHVLLRGPGNIVRVIDNKLEKGPETDGI